jgi:hypothetical protein
MKMLLSQKEYEKLIKQEDPGDEKEISVFSCSDELYKTSENLRRLEIMKLSTQDLFQRQKDTKEALERAAQDIMIALDNQDEAVKNLAVINEEITKRALAYNPR